MIGQIFQTREEANSWVVGNAPGFSSASLEDGAIARKSLKASGAICRKMGLKPSSPEGKLIAELIEYGSVFEAEVSQGLDLPTLMDQLQELYPLKTVKLRGPNAILLLPEALIDDFLALQPESMLYFLMAYPFRRSASELIAECLKLESGK